MRIFHRIADVFGYQLKRKRKLYTCQNVIKSIIDLYQIDLVIDVGANIGQFATELRSNGYGGEIISFEPVESTFRELAKNCSNDPLWTAINLGLGSKNENLRINTSSFSVFDSVLTLSDFATNNWQTLGVDSTELIRISTLERYILDNKLQDRRIFLKLDTQGYDLEVFKGSLKCINSIKAMQSEVSFIQIYNGMPNFMESIKIYLAAGFQVSAFFPVCDNSDLASIEMDCLLVKPD
jgi:FkbM family methyltransferase